MTRRVLRMLALAAWATAAWPLASTFAQTDEVALDKYGWWNANQALPEDPSGGLLPPVAVPPPPGAPEDGLYVEAGADGAPLAVAGVSFYTGGGVDATLTLEVDEGSSADGATLAACPAGGGWDAAQNGRWDDRPEYDPTSCSFLGAATGTTVTFAIPAGAHEPGSQYLSVAIVPAEGSGVFSVGFVPPTSASLTTSPAAGEVPSGGAEPAPAFEPGAVTLPDQGYEAPAIGAFEPPATAPAASGDDGTAGGAAPAAPVAVSGPAATDDDDRGAQLTAVTVLVVMGAGLWFLGTRPQRPARLLGSLGGASPVVVAVPTGGRPRGLGRFARSRTVPPNGI